MYICIVYIYVYYPSERQRYIHKFIYIHIYMGWSRLAVSIMASSRLEKIPAKTGFFF